MRTFRRCNAGTILIAAAVLVTGLHCTAGADQCAIIALVCADGDLSNLGEQYAQRLARSAQETHWSLALQLDNGTDTASRRLIRAGTELAAQAHSGPGAVNVGSRGALTDLFRWADRSLAAERYVVVVYGHGVSASGRGWDGADVASWPAVAVDAGAGHDPLAPSELAGAIADGLGRAADLVVLDCCYGASLEVAWDLREATDTIIASPGRMPSAGLPWKAMLAATPATGADLAREWTGTIGQPVVAIQTSGLPAVAESLEGLCVAAVGEMAAFAPELSRARSGCPTWGSESEMCDVREICALLGANESAFAEEAGRALRAIDRCVQSGTTGGAVTMPLRGGFGGEPLPARAGGFTEISSWGAMARAYHARLKSLMQRTFDDRRHDGAAT